MNLAAAFAASAQKQPDKIALYWGDSEFSYTALLAQSDAVAAVLTGKFGVKPGDRVGLWLKNRPEFIAAVFGVLGSGAVLVPINNFLKPDEVNYILKDAGIDVVITDEELAVHAPALLVARPQLKVFRVEEFQAGAGIRNPESRTSLRDAAMNEPAREDQPSPGYGATGARPTGPEIANRQLPIANCSRREQDLAVIIYTSGTTGRPKGAMLSHGNLLHNVESCRIVLETVREDRLAVLLPLFHSYILTVGVFLPLVIGGTMVLVKTLNQPRQILQEMLLRQATVLPAIPPFYRTLAGLPAPLKLPFRICISGSAPLPVQVLKDFEARFGIPLLEGYGLSEASPVVALNPIFGAHKPGSIGRPIPNVEMSAQDDSGKMLGVGEIGELCVRGGNVMAGYWNNPEETARALRNGWLLTGDIGYHDADGYYYITDRKKDMLLVNGNNVYPREIEEIIYQFPGVKEAAVIGVPDERKGEQPVAFVVAAEGQHLDEKAILQHIRGKLADYKVPKKAVFMAGLPRNAAGKILKTALRQQRLV